MNNATSTPPHTVVLPTHGRMGCAWSMTEPKSKPGVLLCRADDVYGFLSFVLEDVQCAALEAKEVLGSSGQESINSQRAMVASLQSEGNDNVPPFCSETE